MEKHCWMRSVAAALLTGVLLMVATACGDDEKSEPVPDSVVTSMRIRVSDDLLEAYDVRVMWMESDSTVNSQAMTMTSWEKMVETTKYPTQAGYRIVLTVKGADKLTKESYQLMLTNVSSVSSNAVTLSLQQNTEGKVVERKRADLQEYADEINEVCQQLYRFNSMNDYQYLEW